MRQRIDAFVAWGWDYFSRSRTSALLGENAEHQIDWGDDEPSDQTSPSEDAGAESVTP